MLTNPSVVKEKIVLVERGDCMFIEKVNSRINSNNFVFKSIVYLILINYIINFCCFNIFNK